MGEGSRGRTWRRRAAALLAGGCAGFAVGEALVRAWIGAPLPERLPVLEIRANRARGFEMVPGELHYTYQHPVHVDALGLRGPEVGQKRPGELRVLALGDSLVYGQGVADDETLPAFLERRLAELDPSRPWSVVNAGVRAYDTRQEVALLQELGGAIDPDLVVLCWFRNDFAGRDPEETWRRLEASGPVAFDTGTQIEGLERAKWSARQLLRQSALVMFLHDAWNRWQARAPDEAELAGGFAALDVELERYRAACDALGARALFAAIPDASTLVLPPEVGREREPSLEARALEHARAHGLPAIALDAALRELVLHGRAPVLAFDGHYDPRANRRMAEVVAEAVLAEVARTESDTLFNHSPR